MRKIVIVSILISIAFSGYCQDLLIRNNGEKIYCQILKMDSTNVYFKTTVDYREIETHLLISELSEIVYDYQSKQEHQIVTNNFEKDIVSVGLGLGLDYGGLGGLSVFLNLHPNIELFGGFGWALNGVGYNAGTKINITPGAKINPFVKGMYGYNAVIKVSNDESLSKTFYGPSIGLGIDFGTNRKGGNWSVGIFFPIREKGVDEYIDYLEDDENVKFDRELLPITFSVGYEF